MRGLIFDIKEMALNDGAGVRTTVFFKGCPLRCIWCHNPEGLLPKPQLYQRAGCTGCGLCRGGCSHEECAPYGRCLHICPGDFITVAGKYYETSELAEKLEKRAASYRFLSGGVTFSGGEPLMQWEFLREIILKLKGKVHVAVETSGFASGEAFRSIAELCDFVYMDIKLADENEHIRYTGVSNAVIMQNAKWLMKSGVAHVFRVPLIPGITDTVSNLTAISEFLGDESVELLPYNKLAAAKYGNVGLEFTDKIVEERKCADPLSYFKNAVMRK